MTAIRARLIRALSRRWADRPRRPRKTEEELMAGMAKVVAEVELAGARLRAIRAEAGPGPVARLRAWWRLRRGRTA